jgi:4-deoxy-L-threo-5-hexosulose-uronate ketol-isomerase
MKICQIPDATRTAGLSTMQLRAAFLVESLFVPGEMRMAYTDADRAVLGGVIPLAQPLSLDTSDALRADYFLQRRELGVLNIGGHGSIIADGTRFDLNPLDCLYLGRGQREVVFHSTDAAAPAKFYLLSYPAHAAHPSAIARRSEVQPLQLGTEAGCNRRQLFKYIHPDGIKSCQLVMGITQLEAGSAWNTMPPHTHLRRSEVYLYFGLDPDMRVVHLLGEPQETRHLFVANQQAVISPSWSIHAGVGTSAYSFCWGMGGENQAFDDMDLVAVAQLR